jgi:glycosyltransferase involved in cell wall biosynthesis
MKLSVCLATYNEEQNIARCLDSVKDIADEIVVVDGTSTDKTVEIAKSLGARVILAENHPIFHINKQKAMDEAKGDWILQLDADEVVSPALAKEILQVIDMPNEKLEKYEESLPNKKLFLRHEKLIEEQKGKLGEKTGEFVAFYFPRKNYFLGKYLRYGGVYPDGVIRLIKKGKAFLPAKDVHELMTVKGRVGWLQNDLYHYDSPTFSRYIERNNRYINLIAAEMKRNKTGKDPYQFVDHMFIRPIKWFLLTQIRHKGILDGYQGVVFSFFSALRFPRAYWRYISS